jgi:phage protein D
MADNNEIGGYRSTRPVINIGGQEDTSLSAGVLSMMIVENTNGLYRAEVLFGNWGEMNGSLGFLYFDRSTLDFGKAFQIKIGDDAIFDGRIMALEAQFGADSAPQINVLAEDRFQDLRMTRRTRTFADVSDADVINQLANDHGLSPSVDVNGPTYKVLAQVNQSDLAFLRERARSNDAELWMSGSTLNAKKHPDRKGDTLQMVHGGKLREFSVIADLAMQRTSVRVNGWDVSSKGQLQYEADESAINGELGSDESGPSILSSAFGARKEALVHTIPLSSQEAQATAEAYFKMSARRFVVGRGIAETSSKLRVGSFVELQGLGPLFNGKYHVTEIKHIFDLRRGLRTEFTAERPGLGRA